MHAYRRARKRLRWKTNTLRRMVPIVFKKGIKHSDTKGRLKRYLDKLWLERKQCNNVRIYGDNIFFFQGYKLVTVYRIEYNLLKNIKFCSN
jgi:hypothetical protein